MEYQLLLFRGARLEPCGARPLLPLIRSAVDAVFAHRPSDWRLQLVLLAAPDDWDPGAGPILYNLQPAYGYMYVTLHDGETLAYRHPHAVGELVGVALRSELRAAHPEEQQWGYFITGPGLPTGPAIRVTPAAAGAVQVRGDEPERHTGLVLKRVAELPPLPTALENFGVVADEIARRSPVKVLVPQSVQKHLMETQPFSLQVEEGGFLVGKVYADSAAPDTRILLLSEAMAAEHTGASMLHFTFTGDSYSARNRRLMQTRPDDRVLGWYHTHLFAANELMGLSSIDVTLHASYFRESWQVAGLLNLDGGTRVLRFYSRYGDRMILCPHWIVNDVGD